MSNWGSRGDPNPPACAELRAVQQITPNTLIDNDLENRNRHTVRPAAWDNSPYRLIRVYKRCNSDGGL